MKQKMLTPLFAILLAITAAFAFKPNAASTQVKLKASNGSCTTHTIILDEDCWVTNPNDVCMYPFGPDDDREIHSVTSNCNQPYRKP